MASGARGSARESGSGCRARRCGTGGIRAAAGDAYGQRHRRCSGHRAGAGSGLRPVPQCSGRDMGARVEHGVDQLGRWDRRRRRHRNRARLGDGSPFGSAQPVTVSGTRTYAEPGTYDQSNSVGVTIDCYGPATPATRAIHGTFVAHVADAPRRLGGVARDRRDHAASRMTARSRPSPTTTPARPRAPYTATIDWGDGTSTTSRHDHRHRRRPASRSPVTTRTPPAAALPGGGHDQGRHLADRRRPAAGRRRRDRRPSRIHLRASPSRSRPTPIQRCLARR